MTGECFNFDISEEVTKKAIGEYKNPSRNVRGNDPVCNIKKIWCMISPSNVFANVQPELAPVLMNFNVRDEKLWEPFLEKKKGRVLPDGGHVQHCQVGAPDLLYVKPRPNVQQLEEQIKKFLTGKFEDERIAQVKKTTNWNIVVGEELKKVLLADNQLQEEYRKEIRESMNPDNQRPRRPERRGARRDQPEFNAYDAVYSKYFPDQAIRGILFDFEEHMACARNGGTVSRLRPEDTDQDEDIRAPIVQEVSLPLVNMLTPFSS